MKTLQTFLGLFIAVFLFTACSDDDEPVYIASAIEYAEKSTLLRVGETKDFPASLLPGDVTDQKVLYTSSDPAVVTVDDNGAITGISRGKVTLTAAIAAKPDVTATSTVTVLNADDVLITKLSFNDLQADGSLLLIPGGTAQISMNVEPVSATYGDELEYESSNPAIFTVDAQGVMSGVGLGSAILTVRTTDGSNIEVQTTVNVSLGVPESIDRSGWTIIYASSYRDGDTAESGQDQVNWATAMFDNNYNTFWHSAWDETVYPIDLVIDMGQEHTDLFEFKLARRINSGNKDPNEVEIFAGTTFSEIRPNDPYDFVKVGDMIFGARDSGTDEITINLEDQPIARARYIKIKVHSSNRNGNASFTELSVSRYLEMGERPTPPTPTGYEELSNAGWTVTASDEESSEGGQAVGILANDPAGSYWHSQWSGTAIDVPHWLLVDMKTVQTVGRVEIVHRIKSGNPLIETKLGKILTSSKNEDGLSQDDASFTEVAQWNDNGLGNSKPSADNPASEVVTIASVPSARYIKIVIEEVVQGNGAAHIGALKVFKPIY